MNEWSWFDLCCLLSPQRRHQPIQKSFDWLGQSKAEQAATQFHFQWNCGALRQFAFFNSINKLIFIEEPLKLAPPLLNWNCEWCLVAFSSLCGALRLQPPLTHKSKTTKPTNQSPFMRQWPSILFSFTIQLILKELNERRKGIEWPAR